MVCYVFRYSLAGTRATTAVLAQIDPAIEEASASLGARRDVTFRRIVLPLVPGIEVPTPLPACNALRGQPCRPYVEVPNTPG